MLAKYAKEHSITPKTHSYSWLDLCFVSYSSIVGRQDYRITLLQLFFFVIHSPIDVSKEFKLINWDIPLLYIVIVCNQ